MPDAIMGWQYSCREHDLGKVVRYFPSTRIPCYMTGWETDSAGALRWTQHEACF